VHVIGVTGNVKPKVKHEIFVGPTSKTVYKGDKEVYFMCRLSTAPNDRQKYWDFKRLSSDKKEHIAVGHVLSDNSKSTKYSVPDYHSRPGPMGKGDTWYILVINDVDYDDAGEYTCRIQVDSDNKRQPRILITRSANLTVKKLPTREGNYWARSQIKSAFH